MPRVIKVYKRRSGRYVKYNYYDTVDKVTLAPSEILEVKESGEDVVIEPGPCVSEEEFSQILRSLAAFWDKKKLEERPDPGLVRKAIEAGGLYEYAKKLEER